MVYPRFERPQRRTRTKSVSGTWRPGRRSKTSRLAAAPLQTSVSNVVSSLRKIRVAKKWKPTRQLQRMMETQIKRRRLFLLRPRHPLLPRHPLHRCHQVWASPVVCRRRRPLLHRHYQADQASAHPLRPHLHRHREATGLGDLLRLHRYPAWPMECLNLDRKLRVSITSCRELQYTLSMHEAEHLDQIQPPTYRLMERW